MSSTLSQTEQIEQSVRSLISYMGANPDAAELAQTPRCVAHMLEEVGAGYRRSAEDIFRGASLQNCTANGDLILLRDVPFYSLCEHHLLPFFGHCHVAYLPNQHIVGIGKLTDVVELFSRRLQIQERLTEQIADCLMEHLRPQAVAVLMDAEHLCLSMRGPKKAPSRLHTQAFRGVFKEDSPRRQELLQTLQH